VVVADIGRSVWGRSRGPGRVDGSTYDVSTNFLKILPSRFSVTSSSLTQVTSDTLSVPGLLRDQAGYGRVLLHSMVSGITSVIVDHFALVVSE
jgi:hypothetical protein